MQKTLIGKALKQMENKEKELSLIPKAQAYLEYAIEFLQKLPRTEKFNIGNEYKTSMYQMMNHILYVTKIEKSQKIEILNKIDCELNLQRIFLRIMYKYHWIDIKKFNVAIDKIGEIGKILGGLMKYYGKNHT